MSVAPPQSERDRRILLGLAERIDAGDAGSHNNLGVLYFNKGMLREAVLQFQRALEIDPRMQVAQRNLEIAYFNTGFYHRVIEELTERLRQHPGDTASRRRLALAYRHTRDATSALRELQLLLAQEPDDLQTLVELGRTEKEAGHFDEALAWFRRALQRDAESALLHFHLGELHYNRGLDQEARDALLRAIQLEPELADAHHLLAFVLGDIGDDAGAAEAARRARELNPHLAKSERNLSLDRYNPARFGELVGEENARPSAVSHQYLARYHLAVAYRQKGLYEEALRELDRGLAAGEDPTLLRQAMAELHLVLRRSDDAARLYQQLLDESPTSPKLWNELGVAHHQAGRTDEADECYRQALVHDAAYALAWNNRAVLALHTRSAQRAADALAQAVRLHPALTDAWCNLGLLAFQAGRYRDALHDYRTALEHDPRSGAAWTGVGMVLAETRRFPEARNAFARAVEHDPASAEARYHLAFVLTRLGDFEGALRETKRALELNPYFTAPRFRLAIELQFEFAEVLAPELEAPERLERGEGVESFVFSESDVEAVFGGLQAAPQATAAPAGGDPFSLAREYFSKGLLERAVAEIRRAAVTGADPVEAALLVGEVFLRQGLDGEALERFESALSRLEDVPWSESHERAGLGRARALLRLGRLEPAYEAAGQVAERAADRSPALRILGDVVLEAGRPGQAVTIFTELAAVHPDDTLLARQLGTACRRAGDLAGAESALRRAIELDPEHVAAHVELARTCLDRNRPAEAAAEARKALEILPGFPDALLLLAEAEHRNGDHGAAVEALIDLLEGDAYHLEALLQLSASLTAAGRLEDARTAADRVLRLDPGSWEARFQLGMVHRAALRYREALACWRAVATAVPETPLGRLALQEMESLLARIRPGARSA